MGSREKEKKLSAVSMNNLPDMVFAAYLWRGA
jgi:hypothetical protein